MNTENMIKKILYIVIPCYNEEETLPLTIPVFLSELNKMIRDGLVSPASRLYFVDDGSNDSTWQVIKHESDKDSMIKGIRLASNCGHQYAIHAGMMNAVKDGARILITADCDGQDDLSAMYEMVLRYLSGYDVVYGVRNSRKTDSFLKRTTAHIYYRTVRKLGDKSLYDHADYRLVTDKVVNALALYRERNISLRSMIPELGFKSDVVYYERKARVNGKTKYTFDKMVSLAMNGIINTGFKPVRMILWLAVVNFMFGILMMLLTPVLWVITDAWHLWLLIIGGVFMLNGMNMSVIWFIGEYIGRIYDEVKDRPKYRIAEKTDPMWIGKD